MALDPTRYDGLDLTGMYNAVFQELVRHGRANSPRGEGSRELRCVSFVLRDNPHLFALDPFPHSKTLAYGELILQLAGVSALEAFEFYSPGEPSAYRKLATGQEVTGAYGLRAPLPAIQRAVDLLVEDPDTRRAVFNIFNWPSEKISPKDNACNLSVQFLRDGAELDAIVNSRSCDFRRGLIYDTSMWSILLALVAARVGLRPGTLVFNAGSLHLYETDREKLEEALARSKRADVNRWEEFPNDGGVNPRDWWRAVASETAARHGELVCPRNAGMTLYHHRSTLCNFDLLPFVQAVRLEKSGKKRRTMVRAIRASDHYAVFNPTYVDFALGRFGRE